MKKIGYIPGVFDMFHSGHKLILERALFECDKLIIGVHTDEFTKKYKRLPINNQEKRCQAIINEMNIPKENIEIIDGNHLGLIKKHDINIIFHGNDWEIESYKKQIGYYRDGLDKLGVEIKILNYTKGISTTSILQNNIPNINKYNSFVFDLDNTLIVQDVPENNAIKTVNTLLKMNKDVWVISNNNFYTPDEIFYKLQQLGFHIKENRIMTSLVHVKHFCKNSIYYNKRIFIWGSKSSVKWLNNSSLNIVNIEDDPELIVLLYRNDYHYTDIVKLCNLISKGIPYILGNKDLIYPDNCNILPDTGALMQMLRCITNAQPIKICGKPSKEMMNQGIEYPALMIGDSLLTDKPFADNSSMDFLHYSSNKSIADISNLILLLDYMRLLKNK